MGALSWRLRRKWCSDLNKASSRYPWINPCKKLQLPGRFSAPGDRHLWWENRWRISVSALISQICGILEREIDNGDIQRRPGWLMDLHFSIFLKIISFFQIFVKRSILAFFLHFLFLFILFIQRLPGWLMDFTLLILYFFQNMIVKEAFKLFFLQSFFLCYTFCNYLIIIEIFVIFYGK